MLTPVSVFNFGYTSLINIQGCCDLVLKEGICGQQFFYFQHHFWCHRLGSRFAADFFKGSAKPFSFFHLRSLSDRQQRNQSAYQYRSVACSLNKSNIFCVNINRFLHFLDNSLILIIFLYEFNCVNKS